MLKKLLLLLLIMPLAALADTATKTFTWTVNPAAAACPITVGPLTLSVFVTRSTGVSPLLVFFDATATTDSAVAAPMVPFQDVTFTWNFGDSGPSGASTWAFGARPGVNVRNSATGGVAAHLYVTQGSDTTYNPTVTATDVAGNTATCALGVTAYDPIGSNGFSGAATTCYFNSTVGSGCPAGATQTTASTSAATSANLSGKRLLYKCGDIFSGNNNTISGTKASVGAYGSCVGTTIGRPQFTSVSTTNNILAVSPNAVDVRISDIDFEGSAGGAATAVYSFVNVLTSSIDVKQLTLYNLNSTGNKATFFTGQATEFGIVASTGASPGGSGITNFINASQNNCTNNSTAFNCGGSPVYVNVNYTALLGNSISGVGGAGGNVETTRLGACRLCVISNNFINSPISAAAALKVTSANTYNSQNLWIGQYAEYLVISDNLIGTVTATAPTGASPFEVAPENGGVDERIRYIVMERNVISAGTASTGTRLGMFTGQNMTFRDNVCYMPTVSGNYAQTCNQFGNRGTGTNGGQTPGAGSFLAINLESYNNSCYSPTSHGGQNCIENSSTGGFSPATASVFKNNLLYAIGGALTTVVDTGGNTVSNNTATTTNNPAFTNPSGTFLVISDWKPAANYTGGASVPVIFDALGIVWSPTWDFGAVHH